MTSLKVNTDQVMKAAATEYAHHGYDGVSMRDIAARTGTSATALHYHFGSKESLYREACDDAYETYICSVERRLREITAEPPSPAMLAAAMFDEWMADPTTLLLTDRDAVDALVAPERWLTAAHFPRMLKLISGVHERCLGRPPDDELALAFAALVFGYCSLLGIERRANQAIGETSLAGSEAYRRQRREVIARFAGQLWKL